MSEILNNNSNNSNDSNKAREANSHPQNNKHFNNFNPDDFYFVPLGGSGEIGMNLNLYHYKDQWIMLDLGLTFGDDLGIEIIVPDVKFIKERKDKLLGLVLTHAHEDHIGAIPHIWSQLKCPIYATAFTMHLVKAKLKESGLLGSVELHEIPLKANFKLGAFDLELVNITHSIPEANMVVIRTDKGAVLHTGDWKIDSDPVVGQLSDKTRLGELAQENILAVLSDSTNVFETGASGSELTVQENLRQCIAQYPNSRVLVACFASNVARLHSCGVVASQIKRQVGLVGRSLMRINQAARQEGYLKELPEFLGDRASMNLSRENCLLICTGSQGENQSALFRIAERRHPVVSLDRGDVVVFSSRVIPGNEKDISRMQNLLVEQGIQVLSDLPEFVHVSGHPCQDELKELYDLVRPRSVIPVHGEARHLYKHVELAKSWGVPSGLVPRNGDVIKLNNENGPVKVGRVPSGRLAVDGKSLVPFSSKILDDRKILGGHGVFVITLVRSSNKGGNQYQYTVKVSSAGLLEQTDQQKHVENQVLNDILKPILLRHRKEENRRVGDLEDEIKKAIRTYIRQKYDKHPLVIVQVIM